MTTPTMATPPEAISQADGSPRGRQDSAISPTVQCRSDRCNTRDAASQTQTSRPNCSRQGRQYRECVRLPSGTSPSSPCSCDATEPDHCLGSQLASCQLGGRAKPHVSTL